MNWIDPEYGFRVFDGRYVRIDHDGFWVAVYDHAQERLGRVGIEFPDGEQTPEQESSLGDKLHSSSPQRMRALPLVT
jgi:hypothetical protein